MNGLTVLVKYCAACHESKVAAEMGEGFVLLNGDVLAQLTDRQQLKVGKQLRSGKMPKNGKLSDAEYDAVRDMLDALK